MHIVNNSGLHSLLFEKTSDRGQIVGFNPCVRIEIEKKFYTRFFIIKLSKCHVHTEFSGHADPSFARGHFHAWRGSVHISQIRTGVSDDLILSVPLRFRMTGFFLISMHQLIEAGKGLLIVFDIIRMGNALFSVIDHTDDQGSVHVFWRIFGKAGQCVEH